MKAAMLVILSAAIITLLFYKQALGINLLIYELLVVFYLFATKELEFKGVNQIGMAIAVLFTALFTVVHHSTLSFIVNFSVFFLFIGTLIAPEMKSIISSFKLASLSLMRSQSKFKEQMDDKGTKGKKLGFILWRMRIFLIPLLIILLFIVIYSWSNPKFSLLVEDIGTYIQEKLAFLFEYIDLWVIAVFAIGYIISCFIFLRVRTKSVIERDAGQTDELIRKKTKWNVPFKFIALKNEYRSAVFLFFSLNILLFILNILMMKSVNKFLNLMV